MRHCIVQGTCLVMMLTVLSLAACGAPSSEVMTPLSAATTTSQPKEKAACTSRYITAPDQQVTWPSDEWKTSTLEEHNLDREKVEKAVWYFEQNYATSSLLIVHRGELVYEKYFFSFNKPERRVPIYSITKSFLSALAGIAMDQGQLDSLDHKASEYFPEYFYPTTDPRMKQVTLRELLTMSAGFNWLEDGEIEERWLESGNMIEAAINLEFQSDPGEFFNYSSAHTQLLSAILTKVTGETLRDYAQTNLFSPLGIKSPDWNWGMDDQGYYLGGWGMDLRPRDIARLGYLYMFEGCWDGRQVVSRDWVQQSTSAQIDVGSGLDYGYLWWVHQGEDRVIFEGRGYGGQSLYVVPQLDMVVVTTAKVSGENDMGAPDPAPIIYEWIVKAIMDE